MIDKLWLHAYSGKEHGLMVVGNPVSLRALGEALIAAADAGTQAQAGAYPLQVVRPSVIGPYTDIPDFTLSFHLQGAEPLHKVVPLGRRGPTTLVFVSVGLCGLVGLYSIASEIVGRLF
ncbi:hypothetical protein D0B54_18040 [Solimonas sp. K1W22B-7]|uniref:hypothetical protein n=1 Tax=Solimonas sp. K1W22B-7 TaxID=2303331 RepID=UPI000E33124F|nr:hypothetical protein [Solimonas sp. K1W22B-7]AXQ30461.1 hypothetical protein D0B54_18040 [Solimonas sp. K1W22B-7]